MARLADLCGSLDLIRAHPMQGGSQMLERLNGLMALYDDGAVRGTTYVNTDVDTFWVLGGGPGCMKTEIKYIQ